MEIMKDAPTPLSRHGMLCETFSQMEVGNAVDVPISTDYNKVRAQIQKAADTVKIQIKTRTVDTAAIRVWRTA